MEILRQNKIKQILEIRLEKEQKGYNEFKELIKQFVLEFTEHRIEGNIEKIHISNGWDGQFNIDISTIKEDKLKLVEDKTINIGKVK